MDTRRSFYLAARQDDIDAPDSDTSWVGTTDVPYITPANDNFRVKDRLSARLGALLRRWTALHPPQLAVLGPMSKVVRSAYQAASHKLIAKLINAGYLQPALCNDPDAITTAIARLKENLRGGADDRDPEPA